MRVAQEKGLSTQELMPLNFGAREDSWESLGQQRDQASHLKETSTECSLEGQRLKLKLQYFGHVHPWWIHANVWQNQYSIVK